MAKSKLSKEERIEFFNKIKTTFEERDYTYAIEIQDFINNVLKNENSRDFTEAEILLLAQTAIAFATDIKSILRPYQHSLGWMSFSARLISIVLESAIKAKRHATECGVDTDDPEQIDDLKATAEVVFKREHLNWVEDQSKFKH